MNSTKVFECKMCGKTFTNKKSRRLQRNTHDKVPSAASNPSASHPTSSKPKASITNEQSMSQQYPNQNHLFNVPSAHGLLDLTGLETCKKDVNFPTKVGQ